MEQFVLGIFQEQLSKVSHEGFENMSLNTASILL